MKRRGLFYADDASTVLPAALPALTDIRERGQAHRFVRHVRSSQAFALSLFAPLDDDGVRRVFAHLDHVVEYVETPHFEYEDEQDRLQEASARSPHRTQVDVLLRGATVDGRRIAALIEVKLSESNFGSCSAFASADNPTPEVCGQDGMWGRERDRCFQIANHGYGHRRYAEYLDAVVTNEPLGRENAGGCWLRDGRSQPMRNLALAHMLVTEGDYDAVVFALSAPTTYTGIWRRFREFTNVFTNTETVTIRELPAEVVARRHPDGGTSFTDRYAAVLADKALLHLDSSGSELLGVWIWRGGAAMSFYPDDGPNEESEHRPYAESVVADGDWDGLLERLPGNAPYVAWWETYPCQVGESAPDLFQRVTEERFSMETA